MTYTAPVDEMIFCAEQVVGQSRLAATDRFAEATAEMRAAILAEAAKLCEGVLAPLNRAGDLHPARLENGVVRCTPGFADAYRQIAEGGWVGMAASPEFGGMGLPQSLAVMVNEMMASACLSLSLNPLMTQGQIEALEHHAADWIRALYIPRLVSGEWTGTMNLTEPQAGSDVGALATKAAPRGDGSYAITGQKIYISWGDHDVAENICHLVLARLPGAPAGTKGISLFLVPKLIPDGAGNPGVANAVRPIGLEHKMGLHGSPTCVMAFEGATGWLIGPEGGGMAAMFTMMNNARLGVGVEGLAVAEAASQKAAAWALERRQGRTPDGSATIAGHADVRRMLMRMRAQTAMARGVAYDCAFSLDMARAAEDGAERDRHAARGAFLTPIAKAFGTDTGIEVASLGVQVHGGMGYIEETGAAQFSRDVRVTAIYEGTNGIQAMDLVGRKLAMDGGEAARSLLAEVATTVDSARDGGLGEVAAALGEAQAAAGRATDWMLAQTDMTERHAGAADYLRMWALMLGGHYLARGALASGETERAALARFAAGRMLPEAVALSAAAMAGAADLYAIPAGRLGG
ncbi:acyl-CoA dehydrogenase [Limibaculum sp. FT325]|uniref:acyl-CoA dehydrogenase n=1 Tax=Thermohalobaculum sediminis TaxID=2939436 RepID=UPI0020BE1C65|nr:acyl-CoA dehydrogenase [Limibaculum sediminis]MCL5777085.1 acyl-CoA dehydrogenase [Limibaculum sediminis]